MKTVINENGILVSPLVQKYINIIESGKIEESELVAMKSLMNSNDTANEILSPLIWNKEEGLQLSAKQNKKGYDYLISQWKTGRGIERKNNPFGYREQDILENFTHFTLKGFYDAGRASFRNLQPLYECHSNGNSFEYYYYNGEINIVG
jgi:hypothetical protein